eukprot:9496389-Pyramimonas_sp.AAC.1
MTLIVGIVTNNQFPARPGWSLQVRSRNNITIRYTSIEDVRGLDWVALTARSDRAVTNGGTAVVHLVELPGLGKSGGTIDRP